MSRTVHLARGLSFPAAELATKVTGNFGIRGSGKSNTMALVIEQLLDAGIQVIVLDPVGIHFAIRLATDGEHPSKYQIPVLGGPHGDIVLQPTAGEVVGRALALSNDSCVLDISRMSRGARIKFAAAFAESFFEAKKENPAPTLIALEEAQFFMPQQIFKGEGQERMLGAFMELGEQGRNHGAGILANTLRPQALNKVITSLMDLVVCYRLTDVAARKRVQEWVQEKDTEGRDEIDTELPGLPTGHAFVWAPAAFDKPIFGKYHFGRKTTYDAGATPLAARAKVKLKPLDLDELETAMSAVVERAKAEDPRALQAKIAELEKALAKTNGATGGSTLGAKRDAALPAVRPADLQRLERGIAKVTKHLDAVDKIVSKLGNERDRLAQAHQVITSELGSAATAIAAANGANLRVIQTVPPSGVNDSRRFDVGSNEWRAALNTPTPAGESLRGETGVNGANRALSRCARALLGVLAVRGVATDSQISALSGYRKTSSSFANALSELRTKGLIDGTPDRRKITDAGRAVAGPQETLPRGADLLDYWRRRLSKAEAVMLDVIYRERTIGRPGLSAQSGYSITSSSFANALSGLKVLELVDGPPGGDVSIAPVFLE